MSSNKARQTEQEYLFELTASDGDAFCFDRHHALPCNVAKCHICSEECDKEARGNRDRLTLWILQYLVDAEGMAS